MTSNKFFIRKIERIIFDAEVEHAAGGLTWLCIARRSHIAFKVDEEFVAPLRKLLQEVLDSDMAQREEDEGRVSELLEKIRGVVNYPELSA